MSEGLVNFVFGKVSVDVQSNSRLHILFTELKEEFPDLKFRHKRNVWYHWVAHVLFCIFTIGFQRIYISRMTTTGRNRIDFSDEKWGRLHRGKDEDHDRVWALLMHERVHLRQFASKGRFKVVMLYAFPPILFCYGRAVVIEKPGYLASLRAQWEIAREWAEDDRYRKWWISVFTGPSYGWAWVIRSQVERWFDDELSKLREES